MRWIGGWGDGWLCPTGLVWPNLPYRWNGIEYLSKLVCFCRQRNTDKQFLSDDDFGLTELQGEFGLTEYGDYTLIIRVEYVLMAKVKWKVFFKFILSQNYQYDISVPDINLLSLLFAYNYWKTTFSLLILTVSTKCGSYDVYFQEMSI